MSQTPFDEEKKYYNVLSVYSSLQNILADCAEIAFFNQAPITGGATVILNNSLQLPPQKGVGFSSNKNEKDMTVYDISFTSGIASCVVIKKMYR